ncbi:hypothetical protein F3N42_05720 [Marinihelvus fidelis]|uniref:Phage holin family protein n=1 Tax=Marinihelvus fidelis TaxID=2613842 RepID=A0A5N0TD83_9GAMM|nr:hypothetical protein [Marinihelvus fidelis]KAA9132711.1 hypothetical protein F3N42_05720 [Marinihelvus fidelis]
MNTSATDSRPPPAGGAASPDDSGPAGLLTEWIAAYGQRFSSAAQLVMAETRLAITSFVLMVFGVVVAAGFLMFAWALVLYAGMRASALAGMPLVAIAVILALLHLGAAALVFRAVSRLGSRLEFEATREMLGTDP